jgi:hypothetical protein
LLRQYDFLIKIIITRQIQEEMNMKGKVLLLTVVAMFMISSLAVAAEPPKQILQKGDVVKFIKTFPALSKDMKDFDTKMDAKEGSFTYPEAMKASSDFKAILKKHGWDEGFFTKIQTIVLGYSYLVYGDQIKGANAEIAKALEEIDSNPHLSAQMKEQMKAQMKAASGAMTTQGAEMKKSLHPVDLAMIKGKIKELKTVLDTNN